MEESGHFPPDWENLQQRCSISKKKFALSKCTPSLRSTLDGSIALKTLHLFSINFRNRAWPRTRTYLNEVVFTLLADTANERLIEWFDKTCKRTRKKPNHALFKLEQHWMKAGCLLIGTIDKCYWNYEKISAILENSDHSVGVSRPDFMEQKVQHSFVQDRSKVQFVDTVEKLEHILTYDPVFQVKGEAEYEDGISPSSTVAIDCEGFAEELLLIQIATSREVYVFDCLKLDAGWVCSALAPMFTNHNIQKLVHNIHSFVSVLLGANRVPEIFGAVDTQLAMELVTGEVYMDYSNLLSQLGVPPSDKFSKKPSDSAIFHRRPLSSQAMIFAANKVTQLLAVSQALENVVGIDGLAIVKDATRERFKRTLNSGGLHQVCFDVANGYSIASPELLELIRPDDILSGAPLKICSDTKDLLNLLPEGMADELSNRLEHLSDVVMDLGRAPHAWIAGERIFLCKTINEVKKEHISAIVKRLGGFGSDNRAGIERQLHRISAMRNRSKDIIGVTMRVGRNIVGNADMLADILFGDSRSVLFLGEPGSGKTTIVREACRLLAEFSNVCVVDTSNEIAGDGDIPHSCIGDARRMMVPNLNLQSAVMIECVQNHTPSIMVIDEIGRSSEVEAARTCKQRGVRMIASAHGDLRKLLKNQQLRGLIGDVETVVVGDREARRSKEARGGNELSKLRAQRKGEPTFEIIVELRRGEYHEWRIVLDVSSAVDAILRGERYTAEKRTRDPTSGSMQVAVVKA